MKPGNITQTAWNRSVKKQLHTEMRYSVFRPSPEENCSGLRVASEDSVVWSSASVTGDSPRTVWYAALQAAGNLAARGGDASGGVTADSVSGGNGRRDACGGSR